MPYPDPNDFTNKFAFMAAVQTFHRANYRNPVSFVPETTRSDRTGKEWRSWAFRVEGYPARPAVYATRKQAQEAYAAWFAELDATFSGRA